MTYTILDKDHWEVMQLDPKGLYQRKSRATVWASGSYWMTIYLETRQLNKEYLNALMWGTQQAS